MEKRVLSYGVAKQSLQSVSERLGQEEYAVELAPTSRSAITLSTQLHFDLLVVAYPQPDLRLKDFLTAVRAERSESKTAKILVLADDPTEGELSSLREHAVEIVPREEVLLDELTSKVVTGDPRVLLSTLVRLEAQLPYGKALRLCQSENISRSGMLVRAENVLPVGTTATLSFCLPNDQEPLEIEATVVRLTSPGEIPGIALHFERVKYGQNRLRDYVAKG